MANDNLLAAFAGLTEGAKDVLVPYLQTKQKYGYESALQAQKASEDQIPIEQISAITGRKFDNLAPGTRVSKSLVPYLTKEEQQPTYLYDTSGKVVNTLPGKGTQIKPEKSNQKIPFTKSQVLKMAQNHQPLPENAEIVDDTKPDPKANKIQEQIDRLNQVRDDVSSLHGVYMRTSGGILGGIGSVASGLPIVGAKLAPDSRNYNDRKTSVGLQLQRELAGSSRLLGSALKAETTALPSLDYNPKDAESAFQEAYRKIDSRIAGLKQRAGGGSASSADTGNSGGPTSAQLATMKKLGLQ